MLELSQASLPTPPSRPREHAGPRGAPNAPPAAVPNATRAPSAAPSQARRTAKAAATRSGCTPPPADPTAHSARSTQGPPTPHPLRARLPRPNRATPTAHAKPPPPSSASH
eukprot:3638106-Prymnesium_polylepis.1